MQHCVHSAHAKLPILAPGLTQPITHKSMCSLSLLQSLHLPKDSVLLACKSASFRQHTCAMAPSALCLTCSTKHNPSVQNIMHRKCRSLLQIHEPCVLITVGTNQAVASTGLNQATRQFHQVPLGRGCFDDTKVMHCLLA